MKTLAKFITNNYIKVLLVSLLLGTLAVFFTSKLTVSSDFEEMLPKNSEALIASKAFSEYFPAQDQGIIVIKSDLNQAVSIMAQMEVDLLAYKSVKEVLYTIDFSSLGKGAMLYLDPQIEKQKNGFYFSNDEEDIFVMFVKPNMNNDDFVKERETFYKDVQTVIKKYAKTYAVDIGLTGGTFIQDYEADTVAFSGMGPKVLLTLALIVLLVMVVFRRILLPMLTIYPLILGALFAGAFAYMFYGAINMFSISFAMLLLGLGIDFGIHLLSRMLEYPLPIKEAVTMSLTTTGQSILMGALTTGLAFFAFVIAKFKAFEQMGIISGMGVLLLALAMLFVLPSLLLLVKKNNNKTLADTMWLQTVMRTVVTHKRVVFIVFAVAIMAFIVPVSQTRVIGDMDKIYPQNMPSKNYETIVEDALDYDVDTLSLMINNDLNSETLIKQLNELYDVKEVVSIYSFLPENQNEKIEFYSERGITLQPINIMDLPDVLTEKYISGDKMMIEIVPNFNVYDKKSYHKFVDQLKAITGQQPVGIAALMNEIISLSTQDIIKISLLCFVMIFLLLLLMFKNIKYAIITVLPILLTVYLCLGIMPLIHCDINIFSIAAFPLILGIGVDSSIHLMHRLLETHEFGKLANTAQAIFVTSATTMIGFGSLGFINHPGMANLGIAVALGMGINLVCTLVIIPSIVLKKNPIK